MQVADVRTTMKTLNTACEEVGVCGKVEEWERYHAGPNEGPEIAHMAEVARAMEQRLLTKREEMVAERAAVQAAELTASRVVEQVAKELSGEVLHYSPISPHCEAVLAEPPKCFDFRGARSFCLCWAWKEMEERKLSQLPVGEAWQELRRVSTTDG